jgi:hypothetical protein
MRLGMVYKVLDEADIIEDNLRYHRAQGVDFFVVADTGSTDGTVEILERYEQAGLLRLERIGQGIHDMKDGGEAEITRIASEMGADWIVHNDADEFWWPLTGNLKDALDAVPERYGLVLAPRTEFVVRPGEGPFAQRMTVRETRFLRPPKSAHRAHPQIAMRGPHPIEIWVDRGGSPYTGLVGKPVLRTRAEHFEEEELDLLVAPFYPVRVLHFPFRSFEQYRHRVGIALANGQLDRNAEGREVRRAYEEGRLEAIYERLTLDDDAAAKDIESGSLVEDTDFRDYLDASPDPLGSGQPPPGARAWPESRRQRELTELEHDAMYAISRYLQTSAYRAKERREVRARQRKVERRLRKLQSSLWWRLRPRLPRRRGH